jgi:cell division septum initiation protein DivIVA/DNA-binding XRE family transcriptional regulator
MTEVCPNPDLTTTTQPRLSRENVTAKIITFEKFRRELGLSQRKAACSIEVPRSTVMGWIERKESIDAPRALVELFESPEGVAFIHRLVLAAQVVITLMAPGSIRMVCAFLVLSGLDRFVASSYGSQQKAIAALESALCSFGKEEFRRLGQMMQPKRITIIEDETFHPQICLVAMEGASGFILVEMYAEDRTSETWTEVVTDALGGLPVEIVQMTSDEATGLLKHAGKDLGVHHSPDLFHPQQDLVKATSLPLSRRVEAARGAVVEAEAFTQRLVANTDTYEASADKKPWCSLEAMRRNIETAKEAEEQARQELTEAEANQEALGEARRAITASYHPFDLETGAVRSAELVAGDLQGHFARIDEIACWAELSQSCLERIDKARRVVPLMVATIALFHEKVRDWVGELCLPQHIERFVLEHWIAGRYLELVAGRAQSADERARLRQAAAAVMPSIEQITSMLSSFRDQERLLIASVVEECAQLFQRSSSCVEGRNGHLSLFHHGHHRLPARKLEALTVIHNYMKVRPDGTTAAERFFGLESQDVFEWLIEHMPLPARPSKSRRKMAS